MEAPEAFRSSRMVLVATATMELSMTAIACATSRITSAVHALRTGTGGFSTLTPPPSPGFAASPVPPVASALSVTPFPQGFAIRTRA
ncbi:hypothetical protein Afil01_30650 [Actinorhabdospora filicis]|uniref:Uncharacterized protein n=1 Tax=Actinorhabdospora filicis TaxID=1785913 RepID=A0A9W6SL56_9ACTN|nr:hypothetical protein Afil01_30650 [Actinorhabdospora filicis]